MNKKNDKKSQLPIINVPKEENSELSIAGFEEIETPEADCVSLGSASYTKMLGKIWS
jgi:hypothetical protein